MLEKAIAYHRLGLGVIPIKAKSKNPPLVQWEQFQRRRPTEDEITKWWTDWPDANIAIITGAVSGIVVLDIDGAEGMDTVRGKHLPPTPSIKTGRGTHYYYKHPGGHVKNFVGAQPGLDFRGDGGYVLAPPSIHPSGARYEWALPFNDSDDLADAPGWLLNLVSVSGGAVALVDEDLSGEDEPEWFELVMQGVGTGKRNDTAARLAGRYLGLGHSPREVRMMLSDWNKRNKPPLPQGELQRTIDSICRSDRNKRAADNLLTGDGKVVQNLPPGERQDVTLTALTNSLGIKVHRILKYLSEPCTYALETVNGTIRLGDISNVIEQRKFRLKVAELENVCIKGFKPENWNIIANQLLNICEEIEVSEEATEKGQTKEWVRAYLKTHKPSDDVALAGAAGKPFNKDGAVYISSSSLMKFITLSMSERGISTRELSVRLRAIGAENVSVWISNKSAKAWKLPVID